MFRNKYCAYKNLEEIRERFIIIGAYTDDYLPNPSAWVGYDTRSIFKRSLTGLNSEFSFS